MRVGPPYKKQKRDKVCSLCHVRIQQGGDPIKNLTVLAADLRLLASRTVRNAFL